VLDALYVVPRRLGRIPLRLPHSRPSGGQIYFIGATNVPMEMLDPALTRPGRMGRHVWFRTPTKRDRLDIFDLYLDKVSHDEDLDTEKRRDELSRVTNGYSPAMIEQVCSMALTIAHHDGRLAFAWEDIVEAMTTVESGTAIGTEYVPEEIEVNGGSNGRTTKKTLDERREKISKRFELIGTQIMNRTGDGGPLGHDPLSGVLNDRDKRSLAAQLLGHAYVTAHALIAQNK